MNFSIPELIEAVSILIVAVFVSWVLIKLSRLIDKFSEMISLKLETADSTQRATSIFVSIVDWNLALGARPGSGQFAAGVSIPKEDISYGAPGA